MIESTPREIAQAAQETAEGAFEAAYRARRQTPWGCVNAVNHAENDIMEAMKQVATVLEALPLESPDREEVRRCYARVESILEASGVLSS
jgi:hypothetical protein